jgi:putative flippase GtrA
MTAVDEPLRESTSMTTREQGLRFLLVGAFNTAFGFALFALLLHLAGDHVHYLVVLCFAMVIAVLVAFTAYRLFVFQVRGNVLRDLARFSLVYVGVLAANAIALPLLVEVARLPILSAQAIIVVATVIANFLLHRSFSFRR